MPNEKSIIKKRIVPILPVDSNFARSKYNILVQNYKYKREKLQLEKVIKTQKSQIQNLNKQILQLSNIIRNFHKDYKIENEQLIEDLSEEILNYKQLIDFLETENKLLLDELNDSKIELRILTDKLSKTEDHIFILNNKFKEKLKIIDDLIIQKDILIQQNKDLQINTKKSPLKIQPDLQLKHQPHVKPLDHKMLGEGGEVMLRYQKIY
ncbi:hypothetical protein FG386_000595 [Cryptosporidium ryanae]|uniref:uncharacterized protein n=1 Tax=Cryptosporidium ryanae TaxID=515981 RepID=UPI00351AAC2B|nr:hypothetical protein FG386_000595 [Cryptosporidium ryanae]